LIIYNINIVRFVDINLRVQLEVVVNPNADSNRSIGVNGLLNHGLVGEQVAVAHQVDHCSRVFEGTCALQRVESFIFEYSVEMTLKVPLSLCMETLQTMSGREPNRYIAKL
jgi:hypothetical protein